MNKQERKIPKPHPHAALIKAWADGAKIQFFNPFNKKWEDIDEPNWLAKKYRIKPEEPWKPKVGEIYYFIAGDGKVRMSKWYGDEVDNDTYNLGNCFETNEEAKAAVPRVKAALKGESAICVSELERSKTELDGMPLDAREKALVRELRRGVSGEYLFVLFKQLSYGERM